MHRNQTVNTFPECDLVLECNHKWFIFGGYYRRAYRQREDSTQSPTKLSYFLNVR